MTAQLKILLADDDADENLLFNRSLQRLELSHKVIYVKNYEELFQALKSESDLNLAIIDIVMPGKDGKQCLKEMKAHNKYRKIPVIIMTNSKKNDDVEETYKA
ncbi:MAG TPA: response regulator, partial [Bacteroidia bacterium]|nr:response regulator [Bacteroidia bacterium]